jgi:hypothetical protein
MGWNKGSELMDRIIQAAGKHIPDAEARKMFYREVIDAFEDLDWDTENESMGQDEAFDRALRELHPDWDWDELEGL